MIDYSIFQFSKGTPRIAERITKKRELEQTAQKARAAIKARDKGRCFFPGCKVAASEAHHITPRSVRGKTVWRSDDLLSACAEHHRYFKAGLIRVEGNPDKGPVTVTLTSLGEAARIRIPKRKAA